MKFSLTEKEKEEILTDHIPYKLTQLRNHSRYKVYYREVIKDPAFYRRHEICSLEIGFVAGRLFLEFLGIAYDSKSNSLVPRKEHQIKSDDLFIRHFGLEPVDISTLDTSELNILTTFYNRANKGSGHFTWQKRDEDGYDSIDKGSIIIEQLIKEHLYDRLERELKEKEE